METVLVLANGVWVDDAQARALAASSDFVIAADGGFAKARRAGARVDLVVGDLDSLDPAERGALTRLRIPVRQVPAEKDASDVELALDEAIARRPRRVLVLGALGARLDHALTNVHLLERGAEAGVDVRLVDGPRSVVLVQARCELDASPGDRVSLVPASEEVRASTEGLRYALDREVLRRPSSRGVSNEVVSVPVHIDVAEGRLFVIHHRGTEGA